MLCRNHLRLPVYDSIAEQSRGSRSVHADPFVADIDVQARLTIDPMREFAAEHSIEAAALERTEGSAAQAARSSAHAGHPESRRSPEDSTQARMPGARATHQAAKNIAEPSAVASAA